MLVPIKITVLNCYCFALNEFQLLLSDMYDTLPCTSFDPAGPRFLAQLCSFYTLTMLGGLLAHVYSALS
jgi:hypothetical protein